MTMLTPVMVRSVRLPVLLLVPMLGGVLTRLLREGLRPHAQLPDRVQPAANSVRARVVARVREKRLMRLLAISIDSGACRGAAGARNSLLEQNPECSHQAICSRSLTTQLSQVPA